MADSLTTPLLFDKWTFQHFTGGVMAGSLGVFNVGQYFILHSLFELWENTVGIEDWRNWGWKDYRGDSWLNIIGDTIGGTAGFYVMDRALKGQRASLPVLVTILGLGAIVFYNHPQPADEAFFADKLRKGIMTAGLIGVCSVVGYTLSKEATS